MNDPRVEQIIDLWKKDFGKHMEPCSDCGGFMVHVCETALREILAAWIKKMDGTIEEAISRERMKYDS